MLTPKICTGKGLTCGPSLVTKKPFGTENLLRGFGKDVCGRQYVIVRQKGRLRFLKEVFGNA
jgi:hypothetical protein